MGTKRDGRRIFLGLAVAAGLIGVVEFAAVWGGLTSAEAASAAQHLSGPALSPRLSDLPDALSTASW